MNILTVNSILSVRYWCSINRSVLCPLPFVCKSSQNRSTFTTLLAGLSLLDSVTTIIFITSTTCLYYHTIISPPWYYHHHRHHRLHTIIIAVSSSSIIISQVLLSIFLVDHGLQALNIQLPQWSIFSVIIFFTVIICRPSLRCHTL